MIMYEPQHHNNLYEDWYLKVYHDEVVECAFPPAIRFVSCVIRKMKFLSTAASSTVKERYM